jgi:Phage stabilisation protein
MPLMPYPGFCGPSSVARSVNVDAEDTINRYVEVLRSPTDVYRAVASTPKVPTCALYPTPGLRPFTMLPGSSVQGLFTQDDRVFAVSGISFAEIYSSTANRVWGSMLNPNSLVADISSNGQDGNQVFITTGGASYLFNLVTSAFTPVAASNFPGPIQRSTFAAGYFVCLIGGTNKFVFSALEDGSTWPGLNIAQTSLTSDNKTSMIWTNGYLWLFGSKATEIWTLVGSGNQVFAPVTTNVMEEGIAAPFSVASLANAPIWLAGNEKGSRVVLTASGFQPQRISTHAIETYLDGLTTVSDAIGWTYQQQGHQFYLLYLPEADATLCYDGSTSTWHKRALWTSQGQWAPHLARNHVYAFGKHLVGDRASGGIYEMALDQHVDLQMSPADGSPGYTTTTVPIRRLRRSPHLSQLQTWIYHRFLQIDVNAGVATSTGQGSAPQLMESHSDDGGYTFSNERLMTCGALGDYRHRAYLQGLGRSQDRVYQITDTDPVPRVLLNAMLKVNGATA